MLLGLVVGNHLVLSIFGMIPRSRALGPNTRELPPSAAERGAVALTFDDGPDPETTPIVLDLLKTHGARATFFCIGARVEAEPELARAILRDGHAIANHTHTHAYGFAAFGPKRMRVEIERAGRAIEAATGRVPTLFRAPMGLRSPVLDPVLAWTGYSLVSWSARGVDGLDGRAEPVLGRLCRALRPGAIILLHDGNSARGADGAPVVLRVLPPLLEAMAARGLHSVTLDEGLTPASCDENPARGDGGSCRLGEGCRGHS